MRKEISRNLFFRTPLIRASGSYLRNTSYCRRKVSFRARLVMEDSKKNWNTALIGCLLIINQSELRCKCDLGFVSPENWNRKMIYPYRLNWDKCASQTDNFRVNIFFTDRAMWIYGKSGFTFRGGNGQNKNLLSQSTLNPYRRFLLDLPIFVSTAFCNKYADRIEQKINGSLSFLFQLSKQYLS